MDEIKLVLSPKRTGNLVATWIGKKLKEKYGLDCKIYPNCIEISSKDEKVNFNVDVDIFYVKQEVANILEKQELPRLKKKIVKVKFNKKVYNGKEIGKRRVFYDEKTLLHYDGNCVHFGETAYRKHLRGNFSGRDCAL